MYAVFITFNSKIRFLRDYNIVLAFLPIIYPLLDIGNPLLPSLERTFS